MALNTTSSVARRLLQACGPRPLRRPNYYENGTAATAAQTPQLATDLAYYAVHGRLPAGVTALPAADVPAAACSGQPTP